MNSQAFYSEIRPVEKTGLFARSPYASRKSEITEHEGKRAVRVHCLKCGTPIVIVVGDRNRAEVEEMLRKLIDQPRECPGWHVELGGWDAYWRFSDVLALLFPEAEAAPAPPADPVAFPAPEPTHAHAA